MSARLRLAGAIVLVPLVVYPLVTLAGGAPKFPSRDECARLATAGVDDVQVVYGRLSDPIAAEELLAGLTRIGFIGAELALDACGRWRVFYDSIDSFAQGQALARQVRQAGFEARVELGE